MLLKIISLLTGEKIVWVQDANLKAYRTLAHTDGFGNLCININGQHLILNADGTVTDVYRFFRKWKYE